MASKEKVIASGKQLLLAYVAIRQGDIRGGAKLFVKAAQDENIDPLVDGLAESITNLQAMDEEEAPIDDTDAALTGLDEDLDESAEADGDDEGTPEGAETPAGEETPEGEETPADEESTPEEEPAPAAAMQSRSKKFKKAKEEKKKAKVKASGDKKKDKGTKMLASVAKVLDLKKLKF